MAKKLIKYLIPILVIALIATGIIVFSANKEQPYVTAVPTNVFSSRDGVICWTTRDCRDFFIEKDGVIKSTFDYNLQEDPYYDNPLLIGNYLYYIGGVYNTSNQRLYVARIDYTKDEPKIEKLTDDKTHIAFFTICDNKLFYIADNGIYIRDLKTQKEEFLTEFYGGEAFCTNGKNLIIGNTIYDIETKESEIICEDYVMALGVIDNYYYCFNIERDGDELIRIDLNDYSSEILCNISPGWYLPKLCGDKILFNDSEIGNLAIDYYYYDISTDEIVTVIGPDDEQERYIHNPDHIENYDYTIFNGWYYFDYPDMLTRINMDTKEEELFCSVLMKVEDGYDYTSYKDRWLTYEEYLTALENGNLW